MLLGPFRRRVARFPRPGVRRSITLTPVRTGCISATVRDASPSASAALFFVLARRRRRGVAHGGVGSSAVVVPAARAVAPDTAITSVPLVASVTRGPVTGNSVVCNLVATGCAAGRTRTADRISTSLSTFAVAAGRVSCPRAAGAPVILIVPQRIRPFGRHRRECCRTKQIAGNWKRRKRSRRNDYNGQPRQNGKRRGGAGDRQQPTEADPGRAPGIVVKPVQRRTDEPAGVKGGSKVPGLGGRTGIVPCNDPARPSQPIIEPPAKAIGPDPCRAG